MRPTRRTFLGSLAAAGVVGAAGCLGGEDVSPDEPPPETPVSTAPIPDEPAEHTYETMGTGDEPTVVYYASWKCPACAVFSEELLEEITETFVEPGELTLVHRGLGYGPTGDPFLGDDAPRITRAGLALWDIEPESFWPYYKLVMSNLPDPEDEWGTTETLVGFAEAAGVDALDAFEEAIDDEAYEEALFDTAGAAGEEGVGGTPWLVVGDRSFSPLDDPDETMAILEEATE